MARKSDSHLAYRTIELGIAGVTLDKEIGSQVKITYEQPTANTT